MSKQDEFRRIERQLAELLQAEDKKKDRGFEDRLLGLIKEYGFSTVTVVKILLSQR